MDINKFLAGLSAIFASGQKEQVSDYLTSSLAQAESENDSLAAVTILNEMVGYYRITSRYPEAIKAAERAIQLMRELGYENSEHYGTTLLNAATAYKAAGNSQRALELFNAVLEIYTQRLFPDDPRLAALYNNLSAIHQDAGDYEKAADYLERAAKILMRTKGAEIDAATVYTNLALALFELKREYEAMANLQTALQLFESTAENGKVDSRNAPHYASALAGLAVAHYRMNEFAKSVGIFEDALARIKDCYGENRDYAITCRNCATAYSALGNEGKAREYQAKADAIMNAINGIYSGGTAGGEVARNVVNGSNASTGAATATAQTSGGAGCRDTTVNTSVNGGRNIKGLELARAYYEAHGKELIRSRFSQYEGRIAVGLVGEGSECFGFDDEISRDHDFGPSFCLWLTAEDYQAIGGELQKAYESLPKEFMGFPARAESAPHHAGRRIGVLTTGDFYSKYIGRPDAKLSSLEWLRLPESSLATVTNGEVFNDPLGQFSAIREELKAYYPEDVRLKKIAARAALMAQSGQCNYSRCMSRGETVAASMALGEFMRQASSMIFLLNRRYAPFYKWTHRAMLSLPLLAEAPRLLEQLALGRVDQEAWKFAVPERMAQTINVRDHNVAAIEKLCGIVKERLQAEGLTDSNDDFLIPHAERVMCKIKDGAIRSLHLMEG